MRLHQLHESYEFTTLQGPITALPTDCKCRWWNAISPVTRLVLDVPLEWPLWCKISPVEQLVRVVPLDKNFSSKFLKMQCHYLIPHIISLKHHPIATSINRMNSKANLTSLPLVQLETHTTRLSRLELSDSFPWEGYGSLKKDQRYRTIKWRISLYFTRELNYFCSIPQFVLIDSTKTIGRKKKKRL